ncbi:uncharacterized protein LOC111614148 [Centruroides sculpturatus]|uniref:uncharacterized protein LOC111614148 n=1 Tax=Centruroides sculpturatus TaxID=218467 RepID=UPI000C6D8BD9|nr:uncharacterized protein LOC111614148 [Centruroides sculpturatus]
MVTDERNEFKVPSTPSIQSSRMVSGKFPEANLLGTRTGLVFRLGTNVEPVRMDRKERSDIDVIPDREGHDALGESTQRSENRKRCVNTLTTNLFVFVPIPSRADADQRSLTNCLINNTAPQPPMQQTTKRASTLSTSNQPIVFRKYLFLSITLSDCRMAEKSKWQPTTLGDPDRIETDRKIPRALSLEFFVLQLPTC